MANHITTWFCGLVLVLFVYRGHPWAQGPTSTSYPLGSNIVICLMLRCPPAHDKSLARGEGFSFSVA